jgi:hypothetical protein
MFHANLLTFVQSGDFVWEDESGRPVIKATMTPHDSGRMNQGQYVIMAISLVSLTVCVFVLFWESFGLPSDFCFRRIEGLRKSIKAKVEKDPEIRRMIAEIKRRQEIEWIDKVHLHTIKVDD